MATRAKAARNPGGGRLSRRRMASILAQLASTYTTWLFVDALGVKGFVGIAVAIAVEWVLFEGKRRVHQGRPDRTSSICFGVDMLLNAAGFFALAMALDQTELYEMWATALGLQGNMRPLPALLISLGAGYWLSVAPHQLWGDDDDES